MKGLQRCDMAQATMFRPPSLYGKLLLKREINGWVSETIFEPWFVESAA